MNKHYQLKAMAAAALALAIGATSCSDTENEPSESNSGAISFGAVVPKASRAASTTTTTIKNFTVNAFTAGKQYMSDVRVVRSGSSWGYSPVVYWPSTPVDFYAYSPEISNTPTFNAETGGKISGYVTDGSTDLLYAVNMGETAKASPVNLNFRHALARVDVMLSSSNSSLTVKVAHVSINNIYVEGSFAFPQSTTAANEPTNIGSWSDFKRLTSPLIYYSIEEPDFKTLTTTPINITENNLDHSFVIPQGLTGLSFNGTAYSGNAIQVDCEIYDSATGAKIWPTQATPAYQLVAETGCGKLMFPVTSTAVNEWQQGHAYVYNIKIDNPTVLHPINFNVTVDDFTLEE